MKKRNDYISDKLIYSGERLKSRQEEALGNEPESSPEPEESAPHEAADFRQEVTLIDRKPFDEYSRMRKEQLLRLSEFSAVLEAELTEARQMVAEAEKLQLVFDQFFQELNELPDSLDDVNQAPDEFTGHTRRLEQVRLVIVRHAAAVRKLLSRDGERKSGGSSVVHEIASLSFLQLLRLGLGLALPVFFGIILAAVIIGGTIIMTMGGV